MMLKQLAKCVREYKKPTLLTLFFIVGESVIEIFIPFITANMVNDIKGGAEISEVLKTGIFLAVLAVISLSFGGLAGYTCSKASAGFAKNIRETYSKSTFRYIVNNNVYNASKSFPNR